MTDELTGRNENDVVLIDEQSIREKIYMIRGQQIMLDFDLAELSHKGSDSLCASKKQ